MDVVKFELPNGIRCIMSRVKTGVTYCGLTILAGSRDELPTQHGLAHLAEHTMFKGTRRRKAYHINNRLENLGGELNAFTTKEETVVHSTTLNRDFAKAAELISDVVFNPTFPSKEVEREKEIIADEINLYKDLPGEGIFDEFEDALFCGSSLGHNILGDKRSLRKFTPGDIQSFMSRTFNTDKMVFSCVGNIGEQRFRDACERYFGHVAPNKRMFERVAPQVVETFHRTRSKNTFQTHCIMGARAYDMSDKRRIPLALLVNMLGGASANSILNVLVREKNGLSYSVEAGYTPLTDTGAATIYFSTDRENLEKCTGIINAELQKIAEGGITARQLSTAKKQFAGQLHISMESNEGQMLGMGKSYLIYNEVDSVEDIVRRIESVTADELTETASDIFGKPLSTLIYR